MMRVKEDSGKAGLKLSIEKAKIIAYGPITSWQIDGETVGFKISADGDFSHVTFVKGTCSLEGKL